jgi:branched-chain amino acid aminotransferase
MLALLRDELQVRVEERSIDRSELYLAEEVMLVGTGVQLTAVTRIDHRPVGSGSIGRLSRSLRELYFRVVHGQEAKYRGWLQPVYGSKAEE